MYVGCIPPNKIMDSTASHPGNKSRKMGGGERERELLISEITGSVLEYLVNTK